MAATATGRLIQNTHRQLICTRLPPITGPSAAPSAPRADQVPRACGRACAGTAASSSDSDAGTISPAPTAWMTRAAISAATPGARPHSSDPAPNDGQASEEHPAAPDPVGPPARRDQHRREHDRVRVEHPGQRAQAGARVLPADVGERQVDDEQVQAGHEHRQGQHAHDRGHLTGAGAAAGAGGRHRRAAGHGASSESGIWTHRILRR